MLVEWKAQHVVDDRTDVLGLRLKVCRDCSGLALVQWPCPTARLIEAVEEALLWEDVAGTPRNQAIFAKLTGERA